MTSYTTIPISDVYRHTVVLGSTGSGKTWAAKRIVEELMLAHNMNVIYIDLQGDLSTLSLDINKPTLGVQHNIYWTPSRSDSLKLPLCQLQDVKSKEDAISTSNYIASMLTSQKSRQTAYATILNCALQFWLENPIDWIEFSYVPGRKDDIIEIKDLGTFMHRVLNCFSRLARHVQSSPGASSNGGIGDLLYSKHVDKLAEDWMLFRRSPLNTVYTIDDNSTQNHSGKSAKHQPNPTKPDTIFQFDWLNQPRLLMGINLVAKQTSEQETFLNSFFSQLYSWMISKKDTNQGLLVYIDEIAPFVPNSSQKKPICKDILLKLFKQSRKYKLAWLVATQNAGDLDYKAFGQFNNWMIGRINNQTDIKKIEHGLSITDTVGQPSRNSMLQLTSSLQAGEFIQVGCGLNCSQTVKMPPPFTDTYVLPDLVLRNLESVSVDDNFGNMSTSTNTATSTPLPKSTDSNRATEYDLKSQITSTPQIVSRMLEVILKSSSVHQSIADCKTSFTLEQIDLASRACQQLMTILNAIHETHNHKS